MSIELEPAAGADGTVDNQRLRRVYGRFPTGVTALCALEDGTPVGLAASSFNTVSADPPLVSVALQSGSTTWPKLVASPRIGISVFADDQGPLARQMAGHGDRFAGTATTSSEAGAVFVDGAAAWYEVVIEAVHTIGDHDVAILRVERHGADAAKKPLIFGDSRFQRGVELAPPRTEPEPDPYFLDSVHQLELGWY